MDRQLETWARILVVNDDADVCLGIANHLISKRFEVGVANSYERAMTELENATPLPDAVMLDLNMQDYEGWRLLERLAADTHYNQMGVILTPYTGMDEDDVLNFETVVEAAWYIVKKNNELGNLFFNQWTRGTRSVA